MSSFSIISQNKETLTFSNVKKIEFTKKKARIFHEGSDEPHECSINSLKSSYFGNKAPKIKKIKDPSLPKRPKNAYMLYCAKMRASVKEELNTNKVADIQKRLGEMWRSMNESDKQVYTDEATQLSSEYKKLMEAQAPAPAEAPAQEASGTKVTEEQADELPQAPNGWSGPFDGALIGVPKDKDGKKVLKGYNTLQDAIIAIESMPENSVGGITKKDNVYRLRAGKKVKKSNGTTAKNEVSWTMN